MSLKGCHQPDYNVPELLANLGRQPFTREDLPAQPHNIDRRGLSRMTKRIVLLAILLALLATACADQAADSEDVSSQSETTVVVYRAPT